MKVAITGGTGYVGPAIVHAMLDAGHDVVVVEHEHRIAVPDMERLTRVKGDVTRRETLRGDFDGCDAVVHLVAIRRGSREEFERIHVEGTRNVVEEAKAAGAHRFVLMSANGAETRRTPYYDTKWRMEEIVKTSGLDYTIFRPSYIAGAAEGSFDREFAEIVDKAPVLPSFGGGKFEIQPVARKDVAEAFAKALEQPEASAKTYVLVGPERFTWDEYLKKLSTLRGKKRMLAPAPAPVALAAANMLGPLSPASSDELRMLMMGNTGDGSAAVRDLDLHLTRWEDAVSGLRRD